MSFRRRQTIRVIPARRPFGGPARRRRVEARLIFGVILSPDQVGAKNLSFFFFEFL